MGNGRKKCTSDITSVTEKGCEVLNAMFLPEKRPYKILDLIQRRIALMILNILLFCTYSTGLTIYKNVFQANVFTRSIALEFVLVLYTVSPMRFKKFAAPLISYIEIADLTIS